MADLPLALSLGDPAGIGPEVLLRSYLQLKNSAADNAPGFLPAFFVVGGEHVLAAAEEHCGLNCPVAVISDPREAASAFADGLPVLKGAVPPNPNAPALYTPGKPNEDGAALALHSLAEAARCVIAGTASALVTAPVSKGQLGKVGFEFPGQTEFLAEICGLGAEDAVMMLAGPSLRTVPITVHVALADVPGMLCANLIMHKARIVAASLRQDFGIERPRLAIAGLNPHSGENGQFGSEETRIIEPAIAALVEEGFDVIGPVPGDALFTPRMRPNYDAALCMYHDQALIPLKALEFDEGVNVTLGLPIIRTSPDHGTAFDIAGTGAADASAMIAAIRLGYACAKARADA